MINNNIKLQQLRHFVLSAKVGNFSKASKDLGIAQPALSQSIVKLETNLNVKLLKRYVSENGKILPSRITSISQKKQRELSASIKRARNLALI